MPCSRHLYTASSLVDGLFGQCAFSIGEGLFLANEDEVALARTNAFYASHQSVGLHQEGQLLLGGHGEGVHIYWRRVGPAAGDGRAKVDPVATQPRRRPAYLHCQVSDPVNFGMRQVVAGGEPPVAIHQYTHTEPEGLIEADRVHHAVADAVTLLAGADYANVRVTRPFHLGKVQRAGQELIHTIPMNQCSGSRWPELTTGYRKRATSRAAAVPRQSWP